MVLGNVVGLVGGPWPPVVVELCLLLMASELVQSHFHQFKLLVCYVVGNN